MDSRPGHVEAQGRNRCFGLGHWRPTPQTGGYRGPNIRGPWRGRGRKGSEVGRNYGGLPRRDGRDYSGLGTVWAQVPLAAARKISAASEKRDLRVGWVIVRAEVLVTRPLQCYRCLEVGHPRQRCTSGVDRSGRCYRCGQSDHRAATCTAPPKCPLCADLGRPANHRLGAPSCAPAQKKRGGTQQPAAGTSTQPKKKKTAPVPAGVGEDKGVPSQGPTEKGGAGGAKSKAK